MFGAGPFMEFPFMDSGEFAGETRMRASSDTTAGMVISTGWDAQLAEDGAAAVYLVTITPGVLADRS